MSFPSLPDPPPLSTHFWRFWAAHAVSNLADGIFRIALPLLAVQLTRSPLVISGVALALALPWLLMSVPVGALIDRWDRRIALLYANCARILLLSLALLLLVMEQLPIVLFYLLAFGLGATETVADTAAGAMLPAMVPHPQIQTANARLFGVQTVTNQFLGPPLGSALASLGGIFALGSAGVLYLVTLLMLLPLRGRFAPQAPRASRLLAEIGAGLRFVWRSPELRLMITLLAGLNLCWSAFYALFVLYAVAPGPLGLSAVEYGFVLASIGVGGTLGAGVVDVLPRSVGRQWLLIGDLLGSLLLFGATLLTVPFALLLVVGCIAGIAGTLSNVALASLRQRMVPDEMLGRVTGAARLFSYGALSLGAAGAGVVAQAVGVAGVFWGCIVFALVLLLMSLRRVTAMARLFSDNEGTGNT